MSLRSTLLTRSFGSSYEKELGLTHEEFLALGRTDPTNGAEAIWSDALGDSHVSVDERRESQAWRSFARAMAEVMARGNCRQKFR